MPRIFFSFKSRDAYFNTLKILSGLSWAQLAKELRISNRQLRDIRKGIYSFSALSANYIDKKYGLNLPEDISVKQDRWHIKKAARLGGQRRQALYGMLGTPEGRRKGGMNSLKTHKRLNSGFILGKTIHHPHKSTKLTEFIGAVLGDGGTTLRQITITLNISSDKEYALYLAKLIENLFNIKASIIERKERSVVVLIISSTKLVSFLKRQGLPIGNKMRNGIDIPFWVHQHKSWQRACLRGLFDTDGCTYIDYHNYKNKKYGYIALSFKSYSQSLIQSIQRTLQELGYSPTISTRHSVLLRKEKEVIKFFKEIKPSNKRHEKIFYKFLEGYRSGHNGAVSKAAVA